MSAKTSDSISTDIQLSPFSSAFSIASEVTSDGKRLLSPTIPLSMDTDPPDLGAFDTVFRALTNLQPNGRARSSSDSSNTHPSEADRRHPPLSDYESDAARSTVWNHDPIRSYLSSDHDNDDARSSDEESDIGLEDERFLEDGELPTLGDFASALDFLANERARLEAQIQHRDETSPPPSASSAWKHVISPRRKRRRKRKPLKDTDSGAATIAPTPELSYSSNELSSSPDNRQHRLRAQPSLLRLQQSQSTPNLLLQSGVTDNPILASLRDLAKKLASDFPENARALSRVPKAIRGLEGASDTLIDPRGPPPLNGTAAPLIHVFIDHSNILIGFLSYLKRNSTLRRQHPKPYLSHVALTLVLERGRSVMRRVLAASSPLYQPLDEAERLGYEVRIFARVPDTGDGMDRLAKSRRPQSGSLHTPIDSDSPTSTKPSRGVSHSRTASASAALPTSLQTTSGPTQAAPASATTSARVRYREQGVDELLQLKLHQAIVDVDPPPPGSTIVLATGDGNIGQFNEEGFLGAVRSALKRGWKVELYAWEEGLSRSWSREFSEKEWKGRFRIIGLEQYGADLVSPDVARK